jgi:hypothetical protein
MSLVTPRGKVGGAGEIFWEPESISDAALLFHTSAKRTFHNGRLMSGE